MPSNGCTIHVFTITSSLPYLYMTPYHMILSIVIRYWLMPGFMLKRQILINLPSENLEGNVADSIDFMVERVRRVISKL